MSYERSPRAVCSTTIGTRLRFWIGSMAMRRLSGVGTEYDSYVQARLAGREIPSLAKTRESAANPACFAYSMRGTMFGENRTGFAGKYIKALSRCPDVLASSDRIVSGA